jgi:integrase
MKHAETRANLIYAVLTVPPDVRHIIGKLRFVQSTQTGNKAEAALRVALLVAGWQAQIAKARGTLPNPKADFWDTLRQDHIRAQAEGNEGAQSAVEDLIEKGLLKVRDREEASKLWHHATGMTTPLAPLVTAWKGSLRLAQKTIDQQHRDVLKMADHFVTLEALEPQKIKAWSDKLITEGATAATLARMAGGCRSFWSFLQQSGTVQMVAPDPFVGSFRLAVKAAKRNTVDRVAFTPAELVKVFTGARAGGDSALADLIAMGAYTGCRVEELCSLTVATSADGVFNVTDAKTSAGIRQVPIHPALVPVVKRLQKAAAADGYLIPSTAAGKYGVRSDPLSKRFGRLKTALKFGPGHVFHSIRKTVATLLEQAGVKEGIAADILGHEKKTLSYGLYSSGSSMDQKRAALMMVTYPAPLGSH